jgi:hypothetical protein
MYFGYLFVSLASPGDGARISCLLVNKGLQDYIVSQIQELQEE